MRSRWIFQHVFFFAPRVYRCLETGSFVPLGGFIIPSEVSYSPSTVLFMYGIATLRQPIYSILRNTCTKVCFGTYLCRLMLTYVIFMLFLVVLWNVNVRSHSVTIST